MIVLFSLRAVPLRPAVAVLAVAAAGLAAALVVPVLATTQPGPLLVTVTTSPNPYTIEGRTSVPNSRGILGYGTGTQDVALQGYVTQAGSTGVVGSAQTTSGAASTGVFGTSANGTGVFGASSAATGNGVYGVNETTGGTGVFGNAAGIGVYGASSHSSGVEGVTTSTRGAAAGVSGMNQGSGDGVDGSTADGAGSGVSGSNTAKDGGGVGGFFSSFAGAAVRAVEVNGGLAYLGLPTGEGVEAYGESGNGTHPAIAAYSTVAGSGIFTGYASAVGAQTPAFIVQGTTANRSTAATLSYSTDVQVSGDLYVYGRVFQNCTDFPAVSTTGCYDVPLSGSRGTSAAPKPTVEDDGEAQLVNGTGYVALDQNYARSVRFDRPYLVYLTPQGDTKGLYVAAKTPRGFTVRETQGGRATLAFDYRILGVSRESAFQKPVSVAMRHGMPAIATIKTGLPIETDHRPIAPQLPVIGGRPLSFHP